MIVYNGVHCINIQVWAASSYSMFIRCKWEDVCLCWSLFTKIFKRAFASVTLYIQPHNILRWYVLLSFIIMYKNVCRLGFIHLNLKQAWTLMLGVPWGTYTRYINDFCCWFDTARFIAKKKQQLIYKYIGPSTPIPSSHLTLNES